jgi:hypothetical protein
MGMWQVVPYSAPWHVLIDRGIFYLCVGSCFLWIAVAVLWVLHFC